jgi:uncharacterized protein YutD
MWAFAIIWRPSSSVRLYVIPKRNKLSEKISQKNPEYMLNYSLPCSCSWFILKQQWTTEEISNISPPFSINFRCQIENQVSDYRLLGASSVNTWYENKIKLLFNWVKEFCNVYQLGLCIVVRKHCVKISNKFGQGNLKLEHEKPKCSIC